jgi:thiamine-phosphate pyrophosphorylase
MSARLLLITDPAFGDDVIVRCVEEVAQALPAGAFCVQLRDKQRSLTSLRMFAWRLRVVTRKAGALLVVNGNPRLARDVGADGVHLGQGAGGVGQARSLVGRRTWVSVATHSDDDVTAAVTGGADAVLVSPVFSTRPRSLSAPSASEKPGRGLEALRAARKLAGRGVAVFALGGVTPETAGRCAAAGADGVAAMKALLASPNPARVALAIHGALVGRW